MLTNNKIGCLLIHGFTSFPSSLEALIPELDKRAIPWQLPILSGHNTTPNDLEGITWHDWQQDIRRGFRELLIQASQVVIIGFSMGALLALELANQFPQNIVGLILLSPALQFTLPIAKYTPELSKYIKRVPDIPLLGFSTPQLALKHKHYYWFPSETFLYYWQRTQNFDPMLDHVKQPTLIIHAKKDRLAAWSGAEHIYNTIPATDKKIIWLKKSGHEILLDIEAQTVIQHIFSFKPLIPLILSS
jgi:carboxylesterase